MACCRRRLGLMLQSGWDRFYAIVVFLLLSSSVVPIVCSVLFASCLPPSPVSIIAHFPLAWIPFAPCLC